MTPAEFLRARLDEDEKPAREHVDMMARLLTPPEEWTHTHLWACMTKHSGGGSGSAFAQGAPSPERVLAEVAAKRRILDAIDLTEDPSIPAAAWVVTREILRALIQPYADHPDFDPAWRAS